MVLAVVFINRMTFEAALMEMAVPHVFMIFVPVDGVTSSDKTPFDSLLLEQLDAAAFSPLLLTLLGSATFGALLLSQFTAAAFGSLLFALLCAVSIANLLPTLFSAAAFASPLWTLPSIAFFYILLAQHLGFYSLRCCLHCLHM